MGEKWNVRQSTHTSRASVVTRQCKVMFLLDIGLQLVSCNSLEWCSITQVYKEDAFSFEQCSFIEIICFKNLLIILDQSENLCSISQNMKYITVGNVFFDSFLHV